MKRTSLKWICVLALAGVVGPHHVVFAADDEIDFDSDVTVDPSQDSEKLDEDSSFGDDSSTDDLNAEVNDSEDFLKDDGAEKDKDQQAEEKTPEENLEPIAPDAEAPPSLVETPEAVPPVTPETDESTPLDLQAEAPPTNEPVPDEPDLSYEAKLHDIFINFNNAKTPQAEWDSLIGSRHAERYRIQSGDNLWSVSKTIFGDGHYWPKVWSLNSDIKNPHLISPNNSIRFILGDESEPPAFTVTENATENTTEDTNVKVDLTHKTTVNSKTQTEVAQGPVSEAIDDAEPEIPPPFKVSRPVVKNLPPSLPVWQGSASRGNYDDAGISYAHRKILDIEDSIPLVSYISETPPDKFGQVSEIEVGHNIASAYQYIYVSMEPGSGQVGETYLVVANRGQVQSVHPSIKGFLGYSIDVQGEIQLVERVEGVDEDNKGEMYRALVLRILNPVAVGATLTHGKLEKISISEEGERSQVVAQIIGGSFFNRRQVYGNESITYINRGEADGLAVGQVLPIRANRQVRDITTQVASNVRPIGWMRVVKTTPHFATAVIVRAWSDVLSGDITGSGGLLPSLGTNAIAPDSDGPSAANLNDEFDAEDSSKSGDAGAGDGAAEPDENFDSDSSSDSDTF